MSRFQKGGSARYRKGAFHGMPAFPPAVTQAALHRLVSTEHERLERKHEGLKPKN